jgi:transcription antitermination factor NusA-like protein
MLGSKVSFIEYAISPSESIEVNIVSDEKIEIYVSGYSKDTAYDLSS